MAYDVSVLQASRLIGWHLEHTTFAQVPCVRDFLQFAYDELQSLEKITERIIRSGCSRFDLEIEAIASHIRDRVEEIYGWYTLVGGEGIQTTMVLDLKQEINSYLKALKEYIKGHNHALPDEEEDVAISSGIGVGGNKSKIVGLSDQFEELKSELLFRDIRYFLQDKVVTILGMPGIGKTTLAREVFEDPEIVKYFDCRVWVKLGKNCQLNDIPRRVLAELDPGLILEGIDEDYVRRRFKESFYNKRYLIVFDDVWNKHMVCNLDSSELRFPGEQNGSRILLTTRLKQELNPHGSFLSQFLRMRLLNKEESWDLLREKLFAKESCPPRLVEAGKKIAERCDGLPLTIVTVADLLSKLEKTPLLWKQVAEQKNHQLFMVAHERTSKVLLRSYEHLSALLQMCFLYMGIFPHDNEISLSKLFNLWKADGFLEQNVQKILPPSADKCLEELHCNSLVMILQCTLSTKAQHEDSKRIKTCKLHSSMCYLTKAESTKTKFSHILNVGSDCLEDVVNNQRRLSFHNNVLLGIKSLHKLVEDNCSSTAESLLCYGPYHQYQVPLCFGLGLLKLLDAPNIRLYEFPLEVQQLVELRYLGLTLNAELPSSISYLSNLQFLIINKHMRIKSCGAPSYMPVEIWNLKKLKHLQVVGSDLPDPPSGASLESLTTLKEVSAASGTQDVLKAIPNLRKLGIQIELVPGEPMSCFCDMSYLAIQSLTCAILNPMGAPKIGPFSTFPVHLKKLSLSGMGYPWKEMSKISSLRSLETLKLQNYAFRGPIWEVKGFSFSCLRELVIDDTDLVEWVCPPTSFYVLSYLSMKHCYKLKKIQMKCNSFLVIEIADCNPSCEEEINHLAQIRRAEVRSSWLELMN